MEEKTAAEQIDEIINQYDGWKADILLRLRTLIKAADPEVTEEVKWKMRSRPKGLPVWSHGGMLCFAEIWKDNVKLIFNKGAQLPDQHKLFNARLDSSAIRAIEFHEGDSVNEAGLQTLVLAAIKLNASK